MADPIYWDDAYPIALLLKQEHPDADPASVDLTELQRWVIHLDDFADDGSIVQREWLEQIQVEWVELNYG
jgi:FeS assembly protein IscX